MADDLELVEIRHVYIQKTDCCQSDNGMCQTLVVKTQNGGCDASDSYLVIETGRWAIDDPQEFASLLQKVLDSVRNGGK